MTTKTTSRAEAMSELICRARDDAGLNNTQLALLTGMPRRSIVRLTNGKNTPEPETVEKLARATRKPISFFSLDPNSRVRAAAESLVEALVHEMRATVEENR